MKWRLYINLMSFDTEGEREGERERKQGERLRGGLRQQPVARRQSTDSDLKRQREEN